MPEVRLRHFLPALMGSLHQQQAEGELVLEQNDGTRRLYWSGGNLRYMRSDAVGEQFGNFLIRRGVLDMAALKALLADGEGARMGDRVVQWGLMTVEERDTRLHELLSSVLLHALEHPILNIEWNPGSLAQNLSGDLQFQLDHRRLTWEAFQTAQIDRELVDMFQSERDWQWRARPNLLEALSDLPLTPALAYALSLLGGDALGFDTIASLSGLPQTEAARLVAILWVLGGLTLVEGELPLVPKGAAPPAPMLDEVPVFEFESEPEITLMEEAAEEPAPSRPARPMTLMDFLEMDAQAPEPVSPMGPPPGRDPFQARATPRDPIPALPPEPPGGAGLRRDPFAPEPSSIPLAPADPFVPESNPAISRATPTAPIPELAPEPPLPLASPFEHEQIGPPSPRFPPVPQPNDPSPFKRAQQLVAQAKTYLGQSRTSEATRALEQAIKLDGDSPGAYEAWLLLGRLRLTNPAWSTRAVEALQVAARLNRRAAEPWVLMGELYMRKGYQANAQGCFRRALEIDPSVALPSEWSIEDLNAPLPDKPRSGFMGKLKGMLGRE